MKRQTLLFIFLLLSTMTASAQTDLSGAVVVLSPNEYDYDGTAHCPTVTGIRKGANRYNSLVAGTDYDISYTDNINAGKATATLTFKGNYTGIASNTFTINPKDLSNEESVILRPDVDEMIFDGTEQESGVMEMYYNGILLVLGTDYDISYKNNTRPGTATITATFKGNYIGTKKATFKILRGQTNCIFYDYDTSTKQAKVVYGSYYTGSLIIPETVTNNDVTYSVTSVGSDAFNGCTGLTSITIPNSVTSIESKAFSDCTGLKTVSIPNSVTYIGTCAFLYCSSLTSITIPNSVTSIYNGAFSFCSGLTSITIPNSVTFIGDYAFEFCYVDRDKFVNNSSLDAETNSYWGCNLIDSREDGFWISNSVLKKYVGSESTVTIPNSVISIGESAFQNCSSLTSVSIPNNVTTIGKSAFRYCSGLTSVTIPNSVTTIGEDAFYNCSGLTSVTIPNSVTTIGEDAFYNCSGLTSVTSEIVKSFTFGPYAFLNISSDCVLSVPNGTKETYIAKGWTTNVFKGGIIERGFEIDGINYDYNSANQAIVVASDTKYQGSVVIPATVMYNDVAYSVTSIRNDAFYGCSGLISVTIPNSVTEIGDYTFYECNNLTRVEINSNTLVSKNYSESYSSLRSLFGGQVTEYIIGDEVELIRDFAFSYCYSLTSVKIGNSVTSIGESAFSGCSGLTSIIIPNSVTSIGDNAFSNCKGLTSITIGSGVKTIGNSVFSNYTELADVYCYAEQAPIISRNAFQDSYINYVTLHVPASSIEAYKAAATWKDFGDIVALEDEPGIEKCATPIISIIDGRLNFSCDTEGVEYKCRTEFLTDGNDVKQPSRLLISVTAIKEGYVPSDEVTEEIDLSTINGIRGDVNGDDEIGMPDVMFIVNYILNGKFPDEE